MFFIETQIVWADLQSRRIIILEAKSRMKILVTLSYLRFREAVVKSVMISPVAVNGKETLGKRRYNTSSKVSKVSTEI